MLISPPRQRRIARTEPDERLVERVREGDREAFEAVYDRYTPGLLSFCRHLLGSLEEAEDAVQHTFIAAHKAMLADRRELHLKAWLYAIARNRCMSMLRSRRERVGFEDDLEGIPSTAGLAAEVEQREDLREMLGDLSRLPDDQRAALVLAELGAHSHDEIAEVLGVKRPKVKALVFQAREALAASRAARETPCAEIREELATARGGALRRGNLRRHLDVCAGCRQFRDEVQRQRVAFASVLPVVPSLALKKAVLAAAVTGGAAGAGGAGVATIAGAGGVKAATTKLLAALALAGGAGGSGYVAVHEIEKAPDVPTANAGAGPTGAPAAKQAAAVTPSREATPLPPPRVTTPTTRSSPARGERRSQRARRERTARRERRRDRTTSTAAPGAAADAGTIDAAAAEQPEGRSPLAPSKGHGKPDKAAKEQAKAERKQEKLERKQAKREQRAQRKEGLVPPGQLKKPSIVVPKQGPPARRKKPGIKVPLPVAPAKKAKPRGAAPPQDKPDKPEKPDEAKAKEPKAAKSSLPLLAD